MSNIYFSRGVVILLASLTLIACDKSVIGPDISRRDVTEEITGGVNSGGVNSSGITCQRTSGHNVYYFGSIISLEYTCDSAVASIVPSSLPSFFTSGVAGSNVSFNGVAPAATSSSTWSFAANDLSTIGDAAAITTNVISSASLASSIPSSIDLDDNNDTAISLLHSAALDTSWDGSMANVDLSVVNMTTDMHGLSLYDSCTSVVAPYICNGTLSRSGNSISGNLHIRWPWSAFDQGDYYLSVSPEITIEGGTHSLPTRTTSFTIPLQTAGNVPISHVSDVFENIYNDTKYTYSVSIGASSTASKAVVGAIYVANDSRHSSFFRRLAVDRTDNPADAGSSGVTESTELVVSNDNSSFFTVRSLSDESWVTLGAVTTAGARQDLYFNKLDNSATNPASTTAIKLSDFDLSNNIASSIEMTKPFTDKTDGATRIGFSFVRNDSTTSIRYLTVAKLNPSGTNLATIMDDPNYGVDAADFEIAGADSTVGMDRTKIHWIEEGGTGYFYVVYRRDTDIMLTKLLSKFDAGYGASTVNLADGVLSDSGSNNHQTLDLALGARNGSTVAAIVYRRNADGHCYFKRIDSTLTTASNPLQLSGSTCYFPTIHFNPGSGRFIVTQAEKNASNTYDIVKTEVSLGSGQDDTKSNNVVVAQTGSINYPIKLVTDFYSEGNWMAILYRNYGSNVLSLHGYHVSDR